MWWNWFKKEVKPVYYGYTGPLEVEKLAELIELGTLAIAKESYPGDVIRVKDGDFSLVILEAGWQFKQTEKNNGFTAQYNLHACCYNYGEGDKYLSVTSSVADRFRKALDILNKNKINNLLEQVQLDYHRKMIEKLENKNEDIK